VLTAALAATAVPAAAAGTKTTPAAKWSATICSTVKGWQDAIDQAVDDATSQIGSADDLEAGRAQIVAYVEHLVTLTDQAEAKLTKVGKPNVPAGAKMAAAFTQAFETAKSQLAAARAQAAAIAVDDPTTFIDAAGDIDSAVFDALSPVTDTMSDLNGLDTSGKLLGAFVKQKSCKPFVL
jgi:hypothetical protein